MHVFPIKTYPWRAFAVLSLTMIALPIAIAAAVLVCASLVPNWLFILSLVCVLAWLLSLNLALVALTLFVATRNEITIRGGTMHLKGGEFHERVPLDSVVGAEIVDLGHEPRLASARKRNGITLPAFRVGWFETEEGRKLFVLRASSRSLLHVTTDIRFDVLLGVEDASALRQHLLSNQAADRD